MNRTWPANGPKPMAFGHGPRPTAFSHGPKAHGLRPWARSPDRIKLQKTVFRNLTLKKITCLFADFYVFCLIRRPLGACSVLECGLQSSFHQSPMNKQQACQPSSKQHPYAPSPPSLEDSRPPSLEDSRTPGFEDCKLSIGPKFFTQSPLTSWPGSLPG